MQAVFTAKRGKSCGQNSLAACEIQMVLTNLP